jgi:hypothetical protein
MGSPDRRRFRRDAQGMAQAPTMEMVSFEVYNGCYKFVFFLVMINIPIEFRIQTKNRTNVQQRVDTIGLKHLVMLLGTFK